MLRSFCYSNSKRRHGYVCIVYSFSFIICFFLIVNFFRNFCDFRNFDLDMNCFGRFPMAHSCLWADYFRSLSFVIFVVVDLQFSTDFFFFRIVIVDHARTYTLHIWPIAFPDCLYIYPLLWNFEFRIHLQIYDLENAILRLAIRHKFENELIA